ncbi:hypothetical protein J6590_033449 [Homalodisca vitripennis]|nr:hypothetical protein J6590_033449 [Homalodisca vitripennis]
MNGQTVKTSKIHHERGLHGGPWPLTLLAASVVVSSAEERYFDAICPACSSVRVKWEMGGNIPRKE